MLLTLVLLLLALISHARHPTTQGDNKDAVAHSHGANTCTALHSTASAHGPAIYPRFHWMVCD